MIHVDRGDPPPDFDAVAQGWWEEYEALDPRPTASTFWTRVRRRVKMTKEYAPALNDAFAGKCAFCESQMEHVSPAQIEHFRPKGNVHFVHLMFHWDNWLLSCQRCNTRKKDQFPDCDGKPCLVNPVEEQDPGKHLSFAKHQVTPESERGKRTIKIIGLDRSTLDDRRKLWLWQIDTLILLRKLPEARQAARELLIWAMQDDAPYAAMTRCYLHSRFPKSAEIQYPKVTLDKPLERIKELAETHQAETDDLL